MVATQLTITDVHVDGGKLQGTVTFFMDRFGKVHNTANGNVFDLELADEYSHEEMVAVSYVPVDNYRHNGRQTYICMVKLLTSHAACRP
jgi:hypothetical protein